MIPQVIRYFRFDAYTDSADGTVYYAPPGFKSGSDYYEGYDLAPFAVNYAIKRDVDFEPDTFTVTVDSYFFQNPLNLAQFNIKKTTDVKNAFEPTTNHVIIIGPPPRDTDQRAGGGYIDSYCYEDKYPEISSPVFGLIKSFTKQGSDKMVITCVSFLKVLNDFQLSTGFKLNSFEDSINALQVYYEYNIDSTASSSPYFAKKNTKRINSRGEYSIEPAIATTDESDAPPIYPRFDYGTVQKEGYEAPKIAWRLLQEVGWCRAQYKNDALTNLNASGSTTGFINPYETFSVPAESDFNVNLMFGTWSSFKFTAFDTDGLRYDYTIDEQNGTEVVNETFYENFDPSRQSILYNLKNLADSDGLYINIVCCPRFVKMPDINSTMMVWDYKRVYGSGTANLKRWGVTAGFRPKVMLRKNMGDLSEDSKYRMLSGTLQLGVYNQDPTGKDGANALTQKPKWEKDQTDVVNKIAIKYGQGSNELSKYIELPADTLRENYFYAEISGKVTGFPTVVTISLMVAEGNVVQISKTYPVGIQDYQITDDLKNVYDKSNPYYELENTGNVLTVIAKTADVSNYWLANQDSLNITIEKSSGVRDDNFGSNVMFITTEPSEFEIARESQKRNGIRSQKISLPEVSQLKDVLGMASKIFKKMANEKFRCTVDCNDLNSWQQPIFTLFNIIDTANTKEVLNDEGARIKFTITGVAENEGYMHCVLPYPDSTNQFSFGTEITTGTSASQAAKSLYYAFNEVMSDNADVMTADVVDENGIHDENGHILVVSYGTEEKFADVGVFSEAKMDFDGDGLDTTKVTRPPAVFKQATYDEYLMLLNYSANSTNNTHTCTFGLPNESLSNLLNQSSNWIADIEKSQ